MILPSNVVVRKSCDNRFRLLASSANAFAANTLASTAAVSDSIEVSTSAAVPALSCKSVATVKWWLQLQH